MKALPTFYVLTCAFEEVALMSVRVAEQMVTAMVAGHPVAQIADRRGFSALQIDDLVHHVCTLKKDVPLMKNHQVIERKRGTSTDAQLDVGNLLLSVVQQGLDSALVNREGDAAERLVLGVNADVSVRLRLLDHSQLFLGHRERRRRCRASLLPHVTFQSDIILHRVDQYRCKRHILYYEYERGGSVPGLLH